MALSRLQNLCSASEKCTGDIRDKLRQWNITGPDAEKIIGKLKADKFIDDKRFIDFFVRDKQKINKWGKEKIRFALRNKGLSEEFINDAIAGIPSMDFEKVLHELLAKKSKEFEKLKPYEQKNRLIRFAVQRGFDYDLIFRVVDDVMKIRNEGQNPEESSD